MTIDAKKQSKKKPKPPRKDVWAERQTKHCGYPDGAIGQSATLSMQLAPSSHSQKQKVR